MSAPTEADREFDPELFEFLVDLEQHNDRDWFAENKGRYEAHVLEPALAFIEDFAPRLEQLSPHFRADPRTTAARCSGSTATRGSPRTRRRTRPTRGCTSGTRAPGRPRSRLLPAPRARPRVRRRRHLAPRHADGDADPAGDRRRPRALAGRHARAAVQRRARHRRWRQRAQARAVGLRSRARVRRRPRRRDYFGWAELSQKDATTPGFLDRYTVICAAAMPLVTFVCDALSLEC